MVHFTFITRDYILKFMANSLVPRLRPAFHRLQYGKVGRAWYFFSREHDVIEKWRKFAELTGCVSCIFNQLHAQRLVCMTVAPRYLLIDTCGN